MDGRLGLFIFSSVLLAFLYASELARFDNTFGAVNITKDNFNHMDRLPNSLKKWFQKGMLVQVNKIDMYVQKVPYAPRAMPNSSPPTFIFIHGFPTSSYDYHLIIDRLSELGSVILFDHVGFGFSEKPSSGFSYSIIDHADQALLLWKQLGVKSAHVIAHDMGDSVLTEIISRWEKQLLPELYQNFFKSITFTNGGMLVDHIDFRLSQRLILHPLIGPMLSGLSEIAIINKFTHRQLASVWSPSADQTKRDEEISAMFALNQYHYGNRIYHLTGSYIRDRYIHQPRWISSLTTTSLPCSFVWGDEDGVSPAIMMKSLTGIIPQCRAAYLTGLGHFTMLEDPERWLKEVILNNPAL